MGTIAAKGSTLAAKKRLYIFAGILVCWFILICCRLVQLQIFQYGDYVKRAARQQQRTLEVASQRGSIYDRNGQALAMSVSMDSVFAVPGEISNPETVAKLLGRILREDPTDIEAHLREERTFSWIARKISPDASARIRALNLKGIYFQKEPKRFYPNRELAAQVLGYVGMDDSGLGGLERSFDERLRGKPGTMLVSMDARRKWFGRIEKQPEPGENLVLTLDERIQYIAERELDAAMKRTQAKAGTVVVQDPRTGEILALANRPTFDPNFFFKYPQQALNDRAVSDIYEPGSTFKIVTLSAALQEKLATPDEMVDCQEGSIEVGGRIIHDHARYGELTVAQILSHSSDVGAIKVGLRLGDDRLDQYIRDYGFGKQTGIELPGETRGMTKPVSRWTKTSIGAISMGQEIGVSPLQLVSMVSTIANDGVYNAPRIVAGSVDGAPNAQLKTIVFHPAGEHRVISSLTAAEMKKMMEGVVLFGTGKRAILDGYTSAGKTGTAQKADPATGRYSKTDYIASFAGFAPVNNPAVTIMVILDSPRGSHEGGAISAPAFARIAQQTLEYLNVPHDADISPQRLQMIRAANSAPDSIFDDSSEHLGQWADASSDDNFVADNVPVNLAATSQSSQPHVQLAAAKSYRAASSGAASLPIAERAPAKAAQPRPVEDAGTVVVDLGGSVIVPSLIGMPMREALQKAEEAGLEIDIAGSGTARAQDPAPGERIPPGGHIAVTFAR